MRNAKALLIAGMMVAGLPTVAHAQWYVGGDVGLNFNPDSSVSGGSSRTTSYTGIDRPGMAEDLHLGYSYGQLHAEIEGALRTATVSKVGSLEGGGTVTSDAAMVNGVYEFLADSKWHPFLGVGVGEAFNTFKSITRSHVVNYSGNDWDFAYQGFAGVSYDVAPNLAVSAQYRYFATEDATVHSVPGNLALNAPYASHAIMIGMNYKFGAPAPTRVAEAPPAPAPIPAPAPAPVVKPAPAPLKNFLVFFDFDKANITPEASRIITQAADSAKNPGVTRVALTGHTDLAGSDKYNMALSLKRADAVKDSLVRQGVPANEISVVAKGKSDPLVPTKDGVREPQNRRVEIVLQ